MINSYLLSKIDALLITNPTNIRYLTGFIGAAPDEREAYVLLTKKQTSLFTNALYLEQAKKLNATVIEIFRENPFSKRLGQIVQKGIRLGFEEENLTVTEYGKLQKELRGVQLVPTKNRIEKLRMIKREDEIENIRQAAKLTDECFDFILGKIKPGVSEFEVAWKIESFFRKRGAESAFPPIVAFGPHSSEPHYACLQGDPLQTLSGQDVVLLDFGARVNGYCSDMTRVVFVGKPKDEWKRAYETVLAAQTTVLDQMQERYHVPLHGSKLDKIARNMIKKTGFPVYPHSLGHGVGLVIHEQPRLSYKKPFDKLRAGMVVTVEPAIYVEGSYGIRIEDLVLLKKDGIDVLSGSPKKITIL